MKLLTRLEPEQLLIERAGYAVTNAALRMLGGGYGRRVNVIAGKGNNEDGLVAARLLRRRGVRCKLHEPNSEPTARADLVIDAATAQGYEIHGNHHPTHVPSVSCGHSLRCRRAHRNK